MDEIIEDIKIANEKIPIYSTKDRPTFNEYFILQAFAVATRSDDLFVKHGAVIVHDESKHIVATGYNNTITGMLPEISCPEDRDYRRRFMKHAEDNAMKNCSLHPKKTNSSCTLYVTGMPCLDCIEDMINFGIKRVIYIDRVGTIKDETAEIKALKSRIKSLYSINKKFMMLEMDFKNKWVQKGLLLLESSQL